MEKYSENRPWGKFEQFSLNEVSTVKIIYVNKNEELSLQYHKKREEFWKIIDGNPIITIGDKEIEAKKDDEFFIPIETKHRIKTKDSPSRILEISFGNFDEKDIVRLEDKYNRI